MTTLMGAVTGLLVVAGLLTVWSGFRPAPVDPTRPSGRWRSGQRKLLAELTAAPGGTSAAGQYQSRRLQRAAVAVVAGVVALAVTRWPVAGAAALLGCLFLPAVFGSGKDALRNLDRLQGLADWSRLLATLLAAGNALEEALLASRRTAPEAVSAEVGLLVTRLQARADPAGALLDFADDINDPVGDQVAAALTLALARRGKGTAELLSRLADTVSGQVAMRRSVEAEQASPRATARNVTGVTLLTVLGLVLLKRSFLNAYDSPRGQVVLLLITALFGACFVWMAKLATVRPPARFLSETVAVQGSRAARTGPAVTGSAPAQPRVAPGAASSGAALPAPLLIPRRTP